MNPVPTSPVGEVDGGLLRRRLANRHVQLLALGGAIGTGLFLGSAGVIRLAGPSMILAYLLGGIVEFFIMRQLGEMVVEEPVAGSFSHFAHKYWGDFAGFASGWNYWVLYVLVGMTELTAVAKYAAYWWPALPQWIPVAACFVLVNGINAVSVRVFGEAEFWFSIVKVTAVSAMIILGAGLLLLGGGGAEASVGNLWRHGGFFTGGADGLALAVVFVMFSFGGLELVGVSAAETAHPAKTIPRAVNSVLLRILIFYVGAVAVMLMMRPWNALADSIAAAGAGDPYGASPFVRVLGELGVSGAAHILNFIILTAALSVFNSAVYCNSRMLFGLAGKGSAPRVFLKVNKRGVPAAALGVSGLATGLAVAVNWAVPERAFGWLMSLVVAALVLNWTLVSLTHLKFRAAMRRENRRPRFPSPGAPWTNLACVAFTVFVIVMMAAAERLLPGAAVARGLWVSVALIPPWMALLFVCWRAGRARRGG
ncbi:MAG: amino acid permease [Opitutaceae bacterium]|jgi:aromatic amino acid transport protein AroP|nr:amino acid permease [Opitutaceae bacterium]